MMALMTSLAAATSPAATVNQPYNAAEFLQMRALEAWKKYEGILTWGKGQCLAILDDGCDLKVPEWQATLPWGKKVLATWNSIDRNADCSPVPPGYHGTTVGYPSSQNHGGKLGLAYNNFVAQVRCVTVVHLRKDEAKTMAEALQWVVDNHQKYNMTAVNLSPLDDQAHQKPVATAIDGPLKALRDLGIWVSAPCGNNNYTNGISWPACAEHCFAIGGSKPGADEAHLDRFSNTDIMAPASATSSANAYMAAASMILREAIEKSAYRWQDDGKNMAEAMMAVFKKTGADVRDPATGLSFKRLDLLNSLDHVFANGKNKPVALLASKSPKALPPAVGGKTFLGKDIPTSSEWRLEVFPGPQGKERMDGDALVIKTDSELENRAYFMDADFGAEDLLDLNVEVDVQTGIERLLVNVLGPEGILQYALNLYFNGMVGCYDVNGYQTVKVPGGKLESLRLVVNGKKGRQMQVFFNGEESPAISFDPIRPKGSGYKTGLMFGDDTNSYLGEAAWKKFTILHKTAP